MKNKISINLFIAVAMLLLLVASAAPQNSESKIASQVFSSEKVDGKIPVIFILKDQPKNIQAIQSYQNQVEVIQSGLVSALQAEVARGAAGDVKSLWLINAVASKATPDVIGAIALRDDVKSIEPDYVQHILVDGSYQGEPENKISTQDIASIAWDVEKIGAPAVWQKGINGAGILVAVVDTGIDNTHPDLDDLDDNPATNDPKVVGWIDYINGTLSPYDDHKHGTHVSGTISGTGNNGIETGVAPGTTLVVAKVFNAQGFGNTSDVIAAFGWAAERNAKIISYSGGGSHSDAKTMAINNLIEMGIIPVISAGNYGPVPSTISCPGDEKNSTTVGATDFNDVIANFSSRGPAYLYNETYTKPDVNAPGVSVISTVPGGSYQAWSGTSMATPHVSGTAALMLQANPSLTPQQIKARLESTAVDLGMAGKDNDYGSGRIDAYRAVFGNGDNDGKKDESRIAIYDSEYGPNGLALKNMLSANGYQVDIVNKTQVENGVLINYKVFVYGHGSGDNTQAFKNAVKYFMDNDGGLITEWSSSAALLSATGSNIYPGIVPWGIFDGTADHGDNVGYDTPIDIINNTHPIFQGVSDPFAGQDSTEYFYTSQNLDPRLEVLAQYTGYNGTWPAIAVASGIKPWEIKVLFYEGHMPSGNAPGFYSTSDIYKNWTYLLKSNGMNVSTSTAATLDSDVLNGYDVVIIAEPTIIFSIEEKSAINQFVSNGGGLLLLGEYGPFAQQQGIFVAVNGISNNYGINFTQNKVYDGLNNDGGNSIWPIIPNFNSDVAGSVNNSVVYASAPLNVTGPAYPVGWGSDSSYIAQIHANENDAFSGNGISNSTTTLSKNIDIVTFDKPGELTRSNNGIRYKVNISSVKPAGEWQLLMTDPDETEAWMDIKEVYARNDGASLYFRVVFYEPWPGDPHRYIDSGIFLDTDQSPNTGLNTSDDWYSMNDIGSDFAIIAGREGDYLWRWDEVNNTWMLSTPLSYLDLQMNSSYYEAGVNLNDIGNPDAIDLIVTNIDISNASYWDYVPIQGDGHMTYELTSVEQDPIVMAASEYGSGRVLAIGDGNLFGNQDTDGDGIISLQEYDNQLLAMNAIKWLSGNSISNINRVTGSTENVPASGVRHWGKTIAQPVEFQIVSTAPMVPIITDPAGDNQINAGPIIDIIRVDGGSDSQSVSINVVFTNAMDIANTVGDISLDTDQNPSTGSPPYYGKPEQNIGVEYGIDVFDMPTNRTVSVYRTSDEMVTATVPVTFGPNNFSFTLPLSALDNDDGNMDVTTVLGDLQGPTDWAPDAGHGTIGTSPISKGNIVMFFFDAWDQPDANSSMKNLWLNSINWVGGIPLAPDINVSPAAFDLTLAQGQVATRIMNISNTGTANLKFNITDSEISSFSKLISALDANGIMPVTSGYDARGISGTSIRQSKNEEVLNNTNPQSFKRVLIISGGHQDDTVLVANDLATYMPDYYFEPYFANYQTPNQTYLSTFNAVLLFENGLFDNARNVGNATYQYVMNGGNLVIGTFYDQERSDNLKYNRPGWGMLENIDPFITDTQGCEYNYDEINQSTIIAHPITAGVNTLYANSYRGGSRAKPETTVLAYWKTPNYLGEPDPIIGYKVLNNGQRLVEMSIFPAGADTYYNDAGGDFYTLWKNALNWAAIGSPVQDGWVTESPMQGNVEPGGSVPITLTINTTGLSVGNHYANIMINSNDPDEKPVIVPVNLTVTAKSFDIGTGSYPSIMGTHNGTLRLNENLTLVKMYTYPSVGTGGHSKYAAFYLNGSLIASGTWSGYQGDWHNITFTHFTLYANVTYNYTIMTGSYPQIIHTNSLSNGMGTITSNEFIDANGKRYTDWIPAIRLE